MYCSLDFLVRLRVSSIDSRLSEIRRNEMQFRSEQSDSWLEHFYCLIVAGGELRFSFFIFELLNIDAQPIRITAIQSEFYEVMDTHLRSNCTRGRFPLASISVIPVIQRELKINYRKPNWYIDKC